MNNVEEINLHGADFGSQAPTGETVLTANFTFLGVKVPMLKILDLCDTTFTNVGFDSSTNITTAVSTFQEMGQLINLTDLYLPSTNDFQT
ncbi:hypothetical protein FACS1894166_01970 [Bacilli bacterium]|nr:hypothetical protein FACS1894166_01970 [Bacilli bacterium]